VRTLARHRINMFPAVNTLFNALANDADFARLDFSGLVVQRRRHGGAAGHGREVAQGHRLPGGGRLRPVGDLPGGHQQPAGPAEFTGTIGLPVPSTEIAIRDDDGATCRSGTPAKSASAARR
jgi:long-chain acyl-CoA synthetase